MKRGTTPLVLAASVAFLAACGISPTPAPVPATDVPSPTFPTISAEAIPSVGHTVSFGDPASGFSVALLAVQDGVTDNDPTWTGGDPAYKGVGFKYRIRNIGAATQDVDVDSSFRATDRTGAEIDLRWYGPDVTSVGRVTREARLHRGQEMSGWVAYLIPDETTVAHVQYELGGITVAEWRIPATEVSR